MLHHIVLYSELKNENFIEAPEEEKVWIKTCSKKASTPDWIRLFRFWNDEYEKIKMSEFALMVFEVSVITACGFPTMADFKMVAKNISEFAGGEKKNPEPTIEKNTEVKAPAKKIEPVKTPEITEEKPKKLDEPKPVEVARKWTSFVEHMKRSDSFFSGALTNLPYEEEGDKISISVNINLDLAKKDILERLKKEFNVFFKGLKELQVELEGESGLSIFSEKEIEKNNEIKERTERIKESSAVKGAQQMGFSLKKINVE